MKRIIVFLLWIGIVIMSVALPYHISQSTDITDLEGLTGNVGKEDIEWGQGTAGDTTTVPTYDGGTVTITRVPSLYQDEGSIIKNLWFVTASSSITDHGAASGADYALYNLKKILAESGASTIVFPGNHVYNFKTGVTIPATTTSVFLSGASITPAAGVSIWITGPIVAGNYPIFDTSASGSTVILTGSAVSDFVRQAWWGTGSNVGLGRYYHATAKLAVEGSINGISFSDIGGVATNAQLPEPITHGISTVSSIATSNYNIGMIQWVEMTGTTTYASGVSGQWYTGVTDASRAKTSGVSIVFLSPTAAGQNAVVVLRNKTSHVANCTTTYVIFTAGDQVDGADAIIAGTSCYVMSGNTDAQTIIVNSSGVSKWFVKTNGSPTVVKQ